MLQPFVGEAGGSHDGVNTVVDQELQIRHHHVGMGEVDDNLSVGIGQQGQRIAGVDFGGQGQIVGILHRLHHCRSDFAFGAQHSYPHGFTLERASPPVRKDRRQRSNLG